jgi:Lrp/AsnC family transcriptional regulator for asnA, asnC and gidA
MTAHSTAKLDDLDIMLIRELEIDARQTVVDLAGKLRISRPTVKAKIQKLLWNRIVKIVPVVDPLALGYKTRVNLGFNTLPSEVDAVADALSSYRDIHHVAIFTGRYDVMAWAVLETPEDLPDFVMKDLTGIPGISQVETMVNLKIVKISYSYVSDQQYDLRNQPPQPALDDLDLKLIGALRKNALQTQKDLAPKLDTSPSTIRRRLQRLLDERIIRVVAIADSAALGYNTRATIGISAQPHKIDAVARELASIKNVHHVVINTGHFDLIVSTDFRGPEELSNFVREALGNIPGLISHETMVCLKTTKDNFTPGS